MIRAVLLTLLTVLLLAGCGREDRVAAPALPPGEPALWVIENGDGRTAGWLFGTIHALPNGAEWRTAALDQALSKAGVLVVEVRNLDPKAIAAEFAKLARDRPGPPLAARLSPSDRRELADLLARENATGEQLAGRLDGLETWAAALALARFGNELGTGNGVDKVLLEQFAGRPVRELEGAADQLAIFDTLPERDQRAMLSAVIAEQDRAAPHADALARAWLAGDTARIEALVRSGMLAHPPLYEALLAKRNRAWIPKLAAALSNGQRPLIAVGAAHMLGPDGLPALLAQRGYKVRRVQ